MTPPIHQQHWPQDGYVDEVASGLKTKAAVRAATTANLAGTYNNGTDGFNATLTASSNGAFPTIDGVGSWTQNMSILLKSQTTAAQNGRYNLTTVGDGSTPWVLTRSLLNDHKDEIPGSYIFVINGTENGSKGFVLAVSDPDTFTVGTDAITVNQFSAAGAYAAGLGLTLVGNSFAIGTESNTRIVVNQDTIDLASVDPSNTNTGSSSTYFVTAVVADNYGRVTEIQKTNVSFAGYAPTANATLTGTVTLPSDTSIGNVSATEVGYLDGVTSGIQSQIDAKAPSAGPTFTGTVTLPSDTSIGNVSATEIGYLDGVTSALQTQLDAKLASSTASSTYLSIANAANTYIANSIVDTKGDLIVASAADTVGRLAAGTDGQFLKANSSTASGLQWADIPTINNLDDVGDVTITGNATNQYLQYNGSAWVNASIPTINALDDVGDVTITSAVANQVLLYNGSAWINTSNPTVAGNLTVSGDLTVNGTTTTINTATLNVSDNIIVLNNDVTGSPSENAGIEVERGTSTNVLVRWNETDDCWEFTNDGTKYERIVGDTLTSAQTAAYTLVLADRSKMVEMSVASGHNLTVPTNSNVAFPVGTTITVLQTGAGQTTIAGQSGVTINATPGLKLRAQWSSATLIKRATDTWVALGDLAA